MPTQAARPCHGDRLRFALHNGTTSDEIARALAGRLASIDPQGLLAAYALATAPEVVEVVVIMADGVAEARRHKTREALVAKLRDQAELVEQQIGGAHDLLALIQDGSRSLG